ncbi:hypothetical protein [Sphingobium yanoikuyae]|uniref:hypothetical protein n=1 Tax=Sphingobium yanoikuyae TaxID=13690 RepID=UPI0022DD695F|nr:hypothetical protein [Sphingobium yanoikuyae]WBQ15340.1 hypothetical protein PAE53_15575 [Sphingobium yanoikuyae]
MKKASLAMIVAPECAIGSAIEIGKFADRDEPTGLLVRMTIMRRCIGALLSGHVR